MVPNDQRERDTLIMNISRTNSPAHHNHLINYFLRPGINRSVLNVYFYLNRTEVLEHMQAKVRLGDL